MQVRKSQTRTNRIDNNVNNTQKITKILIGCSIYVLFIYFQIILF